MEWRKICAGGISGCIWVLNGRMLGFRLFLKLSGWVWCVPVRSGLVVYGGKVF